MIEIHLYGNLRCYASDSRADRESVMQLPSRNEETVETLLERLGISPDDVGHVFLNRALLSTRNSMAPWLRYPQARAGAPNRDMALDAPVQDGDRLGLFGRDMTMLVV